MQWYPLQFDPVYQERLWGGQELWRVLGRKMPRESIGESWEISGHPNGPTCVANGPLRGRTLPELMEIDAEGLLGVDRRDKDFPLLVKIIAAADDLSIQVHPDDELAKLKGTRGKTEVWYVLSAMEGARIYYGVRPGVTRSDLQKTLEAGKIISLLNEFPVRPGDFIPIPAGCVHALGAGVMVAEIQQSSDTTYRLYDWDRTDAQGKPRQLHICDGLEAVKVGLNLPERLSKPRFDSEKLYADEHFTVFYRKVSGVYQTQGEGKMKLWTLVEGVGRFEASGIYGELRAGSSLLFPAAMNSCVIHGEFVVLETCL
jgi:mannose-6-phosphate isomerase